MKIQTHFILLVVVLYISCSTNLRTQKILNSNTNNTLYVDVFDHGAKGDGKTDDTSAFQKALNYVGNQGGGIVHAPSPHTYKILGTLVIPALTTLAGMYTAVPSHTSKTDPNNGGTTLLAFSGKGSMSGTSFIRMKENSVLRGFTIYYPEQPCTDSDPIPFPWTIEVNNANNAAIFDVELLNSYMGILLQEAHRHYVARVQGQPIFKGIYLDAIYDIGRIEDVHWNPWWCSKKLLEWQKKNGIAFIFARSDWEYVLNTFAFGYRIGYHFIETKNGACNGNFLGIGADLMLEAAVLVEQSQPMGLLITNGEFTSFEGDRSTEIVVKKTNKGAVRLTNCNFWGPSYQNAYVEEGSTSTLSFNSCVFSQWDKKNYAIEAHGGKLQVTNSEFQMDGDQILMDSGVEKAIVTSNLFAGEQRIKCDAQKHQISLNI